jgi:oxygen-independent coproporphyrinogen III oxidase
MKETAIYIHIPFCDHKCIYCDFYSIVSYENVSNYLAAIKKEINFYAEQYAQDRNIISIFFGGGTPSFMEPGYIGEIINEVRKNFSINDNVEITMETNPGTVSKEKLNEFRKTGINRISVGIQSFDEEELQFLTRIHNAETAKQTVRDAHDIGLTNISLDLIFNLPNQSKEKWNKNLEQAVELPVKHISAYSLILEHGTILNKMVLDGKVKMQDIDHDADLYESTIDFFAKHGFNQYEVSNFCFPGYECVHNNAYWRYKDYISFGTSAHSFMDGKRWWNYSSTRFYIDAINKNGNAIAGKEKLTKEEMQEEYIMLALRSKGLDKEELEKKFGNEWLKKNLRLIESLKKENFLIEKNSCLYFTSKGYTLCDEILTRFN